MENCEIVFDRYAIPDISHIDKIIDKIRKDKVETFEIKYFQYFPDKRASRTLNLTLDKNSTTIYLSDDNDVYLLGLAAQLEKIIDKRKNIRGKLLNNRLMAKGEAVLFCIGLIFFFTLPWKFSDHSLKSTTFMLLSFFPWALIIIWATLYLFNSNERSDIYLVNSSDRTNFFKRNKDQIIIALIFGIGGTVLGSVITAVIINFLIPSKP